MVGGVFHETMAASIPSSMPSLFKSAEHLKPKGYALRVLKLLPDSHLERKTLKWC